MATDFSIATPTRNGLHHLRRCLGSVRGQLDVRYEHLVQDGCSDDGSALWLQAQAAADQRVRPVSEPDSGMYDAINRAWSRARGNYLSWLNSDEQYLPGTLARVKAVFQARPDIDVLFADYLVVDRDGLAVALRREIPLRRLYVVNSFLYAQSCTLFYRRALWDQGLLRLDSRYRYASDKDLILRLLCAGKRFLHVPEVWSMFGLDGNNLSTHAGMQKEAEAVRVAYGAFGFKPLRGLIAAGRRVERLACGAYRKHDIEYRFATDELPHYTHFRARSLGGRYSQTDVTGRAERVSASEAI